MRLAEQLFGGFGDDTMDYEAHLILEHLTKKYGQPDVGRNRACFYSNHCVIKFPINHNGIADNDWEGSCSADNYAKGKWIQYGNFICVMQEKLLCFRKAGVLYKDLPNWTGSIDGAQVGFDIKGRLKAYDFGLR